MQPTFRTCPLRMTCTPLPGAHIRHAALLEPGRQWRRSEPLAATHDDPHRCGHVGLVGSAARPDADRTVTEGSHMRRTRTLPYLLAVCALMAATFGAAAPALAAAGGTGHTITMT